MNYLWEVMLQLTKQELLEDQVLFKMAERYSGYMELSLPCINQEKVDRLEIEVNPYWRFYNVFKDLFNPEMQEFPQLRKSLTNLILHTLAQNDVMSGMTRNEY